MPRGDDSAPGTNGIEPSDWLGLVGAGIVLGLGALAPSPPGIGNDLQLLFGIFLATVVLWIAKPVPYAVSSLLSVILLFGFGIAETFQEAVIGFASTLVFFFVLLLLLGRSIAKVDLDDWIANRLVSATTTPRGSIRRLTSTILLLAFIMPSSTARTVTFMPVIDQVNDAYGLDEDSRFRRSAYYVIGHLNPIGSTALMTGGGMSVVTAELIGSLVSPITWLEWAIFMIPPTVAIFFLAAAIGIRLFGVADERRSGEMGTARSNGAVDDGTRPLERDQKLVLVTLVAAIGLWIVGSFLGISAIVPAMFVVAVFSLPGIRIITADDFRNLSWGIVFLIGAMLSILEAMQRLDAFDVIVDLLFSGLPIETLGGIVLVVIFAFAVVVRSIFSSVAAAIVILLPIVLEFAGLLGVDQVFASFALLLILVSSTFLPFNVSTALLAHDRGPLSITEVFLLGGLTLGSAVVVVAVSWIGYWPMLEQIIGEIA